MSEPFEISDTERPIQIMNTITLSSESSIKESQQGSFKNISGLSPSRVEQYMQQFSSVGTSNTTTSVSSNRNSNRNGTRYRKKGFKRFKKKRIKTMSLASNSVQTAQKNYYQDDPGFSPADFSMQWEGLRGVTLD